FFVFIARGFDAGAVRLPSGVATADCQAPLRSPYAPTSFQREVVMRRFRFTHLAIGLLLCPVALRSAAAIAASPAGEHTVAMELPPEYRAWFKNPDGSCVQCSNGMVGMHINRPEWTFLLWDTPYGPAVHGGSWPGRVAEYARQRGMRLFNVTGDSF